MDVERSRADRRGRDTCTSPSSFFPSQLAFGRANLNTRTGRWSQASVGSFLNESPETPRGMCAIAILVGKLGTELLPSPPERIPGHSRRQARVTHLDDIVTRATKLRSKTSQPRKGETTGFSGRDSVPDRRGVPRVENHFSTSWKSRSADVKPRSDPSTLPPKGGVPRRGAPLPHFGERDRSDVRQPRLADKSSEWLIAVPDMGGRLAPVPRHSESSAADGHCDQDGRTRRRNQNDDGELPSRAHDATSRVNRSRSPRNTACARSVASSSLNWGPPASEKSGPE